MDQTNITHKIDGQYRNVYVVDPLGNTLAIDDMAIDAVKLAGGNRVNFAYKWFPFDNIDSPAWGVYAEGYGMIENGIERMRNGLFHR